MTDTEPQTAAEPAKDLTPKAVDMLRKKMILYDQKADKYEELEKHYRAKGDHDRAERYSIKGKACDQVVIDCATKIAPFETPRLEAIEVKSEVEHKYVIRLPQEIKSVDEWCKVTGAKMLEKDKQSDKLTPKPKYSNGTHRPIILDNEDDTNKTVN